MLPHICLRVGYATFCADFDFLRPGHEYQIKFRAGNPKAPLFILSQRFQVAWGRFNISEFERPPRPTTVGQVMQGASAFVENLQARAGAIASFLLWLRCAMPDADMAECAS